MYLVRLWDCFLETHGTILHGKWVAVKGILRICMDAHHICTDDAAREGTAQGALPCI